MTKKTITIMMFPLLFLLVLTISYARAADRQMTIGTASMGGAYYPIGTGIAEIVTKYVSGVKVTAEVTGGSTENPRLVGSGETDIGICNANHAYQARAGQAPFKKKFDILAIGGLHGSVLHIVTLDRTGVNAVPDMKGKKIAAGPAGGGSVQMIKSVFSVYDEIAFEDVTPSYVSYSDGVTALKDGNVDAALIGAGYPAAAVLELGATEKVKFVTISEEKLAALHERYPYYKGVSIPKSVYKTDADVRVMGVSNVLVVNANMDEQTAYEITKAVYAHLDELAQYHAAVKKVDIEDAANVAGVPLHPGAMKYFKEQGLIK